MFGISKKGFYFVVLVAALIGFTAYSVHKAATCLTVKDQDPTKGSQGYRTWYGATLKSFEHFGRKVCVPQGWEAIGYEHLENGVATFADGKTGVLIRSDAFVSEKINPKGTRYDITLLFPSFVDEKTRALYRQMTSNAFEKVGAMYPDSGTSIPHAVLVTAGLNGATSNEGGRVYPDPDANLTSIVRTPDDPRSEELLLHAITHLYNRHRTDLLAYQKSQIPFEPEDWQEAEATWAETGLASNTKGVEARLQYLYSVHNAVMQKRFDLIREPPFNVKDEFESIVPRMVVPLESPNIDYQYGHYILAPLTMTAIDTLLSAQGSSMRSVLTDIHTNPSKNFLETISAIVSKTEMDMIRAWIEGREVIPRNLVLP